MKLSSLLSPLSSLLSPFSSSHWSDKFSSFIDNHNRGEHFWHCDGSTF